MIPLSILDLAPVTVGSTPARTFANTLELARQGEALGYRRFWLAEHHNMPGIASAATSVLIGHVAGGDPRPVGHHVVYGVAIACSDRRRCQGQAGENHRRPNPCPPREAPHGDRPPTLVSDRSGWEYARESRAFECE